MGMGEGGEGGQEGSFPLPKLNYQGMVCVFSSELHYLKKYILHGEIQLLSL